MSATHFRAFYGNVHHVHSGRQLNLQTLPSTPPSSFSPVKPSGGGGGEKTHVLHTREVFLILCATAGDVSHADGAGGGGGRWEHRPKKISSPRQKCSRTCLPASCFLIGLSLTPPTPLSSLPPPPSWEEEEEKPTDPYNIRPDPDPPPLDVEPIRR